jgi:hypothetical protein
MQVKGVSLLDIQEYLLSDLDHTSLKTILRIIFWGILLLLILWIIYFIVVTISIPYQIEYREGAAPVMTEFFLKRENPFSLENQPLGMNNYGFVYSLFVWPFAALFGNTLLVYRIVTFFFIILSCLLVFQTTSRINSERYLAFMGAAFVAMGLAARGGEGAFPSAMGEFLFLAAILIPFNRSFDHPALVLSAVLGVIAYYTKPYFVLSFGIVASYLFVFVSKREGLFYSLLFVIMFVFSFLLVRFFYKFYFIDTFVSNLTNTSINTFGAVTKQMLEFGREFYLTLILCGALLFLNIGMLHLGKVSLRRLFGYFDFLSLDRPLVSQPVNYLTYFFIFSSLTFILVLGWNPGTYMHYIYQIMLPPFFLLLFQSIRPSTRLTLISFSLLLLNMILFSQLRFNAGFLRQKDSRDWARLFQSVGNSKHILNNPVITSEMIRRGIPPVDSGQTEIYYYIGSYPDNILIGPNYQILKSNGGQYRNSVRHTVIEAGYDRIFLTKGSGFPLLVPDAMSRHYFLADTITVGMPQVGQSWTVEIWEPITK